jgi:hypothetical protein
VKPPPKVEKKLLAVNPVVEPAAAIAAAPTPVAINAPSTAIRTNLFFKSFLPTLTTPLTTLPTPLTTFLTTLPTPLTTFLMPPVIFLNIFFKKSHLLLNKFINCIIS